MFLENLRNIFAFKIGILCVQHVLLGGCSGVR